MGADVPAGVENGSVSSVRYRSSHGLIVWMLLGIATLTTIGGIGARWLDDQVLSTSGWTHASGQVFGNPTVRRAVSNFAVQRAFQDGGIDQALDSALGDTAGGVASVRLRAASAPIADRVLGSRPARRAWRRANRSAQRQLVRSLEGSRGGPVVLDLSPIVVSVLDGLAGSSVAQAIPGAASALRAPRPHAGRITVLTASQARPVRSAVSVVRVLAWALWAAATAAFAVALLLASGRRARTLSRIGYRLVFAGAIVLLVRWLFQFVFADLVATLGVDRAALRAGWTGATADLRTLATGVLVVGVVVAVVSWGVRLVSRSD